jgi:hypothetical protein
MSALMSAFTILFLFWTITHFARRIMQLKDKTLNGQQIFTIMTAGVVGALAYTFSDSFWYSAVEGEVYAMSSFFTALVFWMMLKWEHQADQPGADKWVVLIFFMMGLSIGVHLLSLLTLPAIVMIYYFRKFKITPWGTFIAFVTGCIITGVVQKLIIQYTVDGAGTFDRWFVNGLGLPFYSGFFFFFIFLAALVFFGLRVAKQKSWHFLRLGIWCFVFMLLGYSTYFTTLIRSAADPAVDMYNVDNPMALMGYLGREQYGDFPLLRGQVFTATPERTKAPNATPRVRKITSHWATIPFPFTRPRIRCSSPAYGMPVTTRAMPTSTLPGWVWPKAKRQPTKTMFTGPSVTKSTGCTCAISCGISRANKMTCRASATCVTATGYRAFHLSTTSDWAIRIKFLTVSSTTKPTMNSTSYHSFWD